MTTYALYETVLRVHVYPCLGAMRLDRLTEAHMALFAALERGSVGARTREVIRRKLKAALAAAAGGCL